MTKWNEESAIAAMTGFFASIEETTTAENARAAAMKPWRIATSGNLRVPAFYDESKLQKTVDAVMQNRYVADNFDSKTVEVRVADACILQKHKKQEDQGCFFEELLASFTRADVRPINVYMTVYGAVITERFKIGRYEFVPGDQFDTLELRSVPDAMREELKNKIWDNRGHVCVTMSCCDCSKARELAVPEMQWLECVMRMFLDGKVHDFGVLSFDFAWAQNSMAISEGGMFANFSSSQQGCVTSFDLADFFNKTPAARIIIENLGKDKTELNEFHKRLRYAIYLVGLSKKQRDISVAYFLCVAAFETLFVSHGSQYMNPGIAYQITETLCLLLATPENRRQLFDDMQGVYAKRSAVAHGAAKSITKEELRTVQSIARDAIIKILVDPVLSQVTDIKQLAEMVADAKFGKRTGSCN